MIISPRTVRGYLIGEPPAKLVIKHQNVVVDAFNAPIDFVAFDLFGIVKLGTLADLLQHVCAYHRVMRVANNFAIEKKFH